jgi:hypothetical protein
MYFSAHDNFRQWTHILQPIVEAYNNSIHHTIEMAPADVTRSNAPQLFDFLEQKRKAKGRNRQNKFEVGDLVRIPVDPDFKNKLGKKGSTPNWTRELFQIDIVEFGTLVPTYFVCDLSGKRIPDRFYEKQINLVTALSELSAL